MKKPDTSKSLSEQVCETVDAMELTSIDEINLLAQQMGKQHNQRKLDHFCGLSPEQMSNFIYKPFESPTVIAYSTDIDIPNDTSAMMLMTMLLDGLSEDGLKLTAKGNLPMKFCQFAAQHYYAIEANKQERYTSSPRTETDFIALHCIRLVADMAGLTRKYKGRLLLTKKGQKLSTPEQRGALFLLLFQTYTLPFNWAYNDGHPDAVIVQHAFLYTLYLISQYGETPQLQTFYEDKFITAFPMIFDEMEDTVYRSKEDQARSCYTLRTIDRFAEFFGFIEMKYDNGDFNNRKLIITKTPLLNQFIQFNI